MRKQSRDQELRKAAQSLAEHYRLERDELQKLVRQLQNKAIPLDEHWRIAATRAEKRLRRLRVEQKANLLHRRVRAIGKQLWEVYKLSRGLHRPEGSYWTDEHGERRIHGPRGTKR